MVENQSRTLAQAVKEYKKRYGINPPKGFDTWYRFAQKNGVILIDEYDLLSSQIHPYLSVHPDVLNDRIAQAFENGMSDMISIGSVLLEEEDEEAGAVEQERNTNTKARSSTRHRKYLDVNYSDEFDLRAYHQWELMDPFVEYMELGVRIFLGSHDVPLSRVSYKLKNRAREKSREGEIFSEEELEGLEFLPGSNRPYTGLWHGCKEGTPGFEERDMDYSKRLTPHDRSEKSFIYDHNKAMDYCQFPEWRKLHNIYGFPKGVKMQSLIPILGASGSPSFGDINYASVYHFSMMWTRTSWDDQNRKDKIFWRGSNTGTYGSSIQKGLVHWSDTQRYRLVTFTHGTGNNISGDGMQVVYFSDSPTQDKVYSSRMPREVLNKDFFDVDFAGVPIQCDPEVCKEIADKFPVKEYRVSAFRAQKYKYHIDVDGNGFSGRFYNLLASEIVVFKATVYQEAMQSFLIPWYHYVPLQIDYSDLYDIAAFFLGEPNGEGKPRINSHDKEARQIAMNGLEFTRIHWRKEDIQAYTFRLMLEWNRMMRVDRENGDYLG